MTPERKKYLAGISKEEKNVRYFLGIYKSSIKHLKSYLNTSDYKDIKGAKNAIAETKAVIKALKKQLPANEGWPYYCCVCGYDMGYRECYCPNCGQKLR